ncbi:MAG: glycosyltransferase [Anaerohalosphaeraceae bacterium]
MIRKARHDLTESQALPDSLVNALQLFQNAQKAFAAGNMLTARRLMAQYQSVMNYDHLPRIDRRDNAGSPLMSVVIVTYQRSEDVAKLLDCFQRQTDRDFETIVVDNGGTDINAITGKADCIIPCPINFNLSEGRNIGACFARGQIVVFVDDDALVDADYTASVRQAFQTYNVLGLRGRTLPKTPTSNKHISICDRGDKPFPTLCNQEGNSAFLLWAWRAVGGQDPLLFGHEGTDLTWRLIHAFGRRDAVMYWPGTVIYHDYGDGGKARRKRHQQEINQDYLLYKYDESISDIRLQLENLPLTKGDALSVRPLVATEARRWYCLCYQDNLQKLDAVPTPKVAVIIACYNMAEYLPQCLDGILAQTIRNWETVIVDDGSTDGSREILQRYSQMDKRFRVFFFDKSEGPYIRRNFAIQHARAPFISIQDADDILAPQKLELLLEEILKDDSLGVVGSFFGRFIDTYRGAEYCDRIRLKVSPSEIAKDVQRSWYVCWHASAVIRKTLFEQVGLYDCQPWGSDTFWLAKAAVYGILTGRVRFKNLPEILTYKREHKKSQTGTILLNHPNGRRKVLSRYGQQKLTEISQKAQQNPGFDVGQAIRDCNCNDFIPRFGHLFEQWESGAVTRQMIAGMLSKATRELCSRYYSDCLISLNSLCDVYKGVEKQIQGLNLLRGLCQFIGGEDESARLSLQQECTDHGTFQAGDFLSRYLAQTAHRPGGAQRRQMVDQFVFTDTHKPSVDAEVIYDNRDASAPKVSVVLDCRQGTVDLETVIAEWTAQTDKNFELLILTTGNSKADFAGQTLPVRSAVLNFAEGTTRAAVKNQAVSFARGEILLFVSSHIAVRADCVATVCDALSTPAIGAVSGRVLSAAGGWNTNLDYGDKKLFCCLEQDLLCAVKRQVFDRAGGLEEGLWGREMLSLSWAIYDGSDTDFGSILYVPGLAGTWRSDVPVTTDFVLRQLVGEQLYWRRSCPITYWIFISFTERCCWANEIPTDADPAVIPNIVQYFTGKHRAIALQWARLAYRLKPDRLGELFGLANCEWDAGNIDQAARYFEQVLAVPFMRCIESRIFSPEERSKVVEVIHCYITAVLKLAEYYKAGGQTMKAQQMLSQLKTNVNCVLDAEQQKQFDQLYQGVQTTSGKNVPSLTASRSQSPLVSVIMPACNSAAYIDAAIQSVLAQTYPNFELIIVNDGSTDNTEQVIQNYRDNRIHCFSQANAGLAATRNAAIRHSTGQFIIPLDDDDRMKPEFIEQHVAAFKRHPEADLIYCDDHLVNETGQSIRVIQRKEVSDQTQLICSLFQGGFPFIPFRTCIRRSVFDKIGLYDETLRVAEDYDMMRRFAAQGLIAKHLPGDFYIRQVRTDSLSRNHTRQKAETHFGVIRQFIETFSWEQLFPDTNWNELTPKHRDFQGRYLSARVFQAIESNYMQNNAPGFYADVAMDFAIEQLEYCLELSPDNREVIQRIETCRQRKSQFAAGALV